MSEKLRPGFYNLGTEDKPVNVPNPAIDDPNSIEGKEFWEGVANGGIEFPDLETLDRALELAKKS